VGTRPILGDPSVPPADSRYRLRAVLGASAALAARRPTLHRRRADVSAVHIGVPALDEPEEHGAVDASPLPLRTSSLPLWRLATRLARAVGRVKHAQCRISAGATRKQPNVDSIRVGNGANITRDRTRSVSGCGDDFLRLRGLASTRGRLHPPTSAALPLGTTSSSAKPARRLLLGPRLPARPR
jgi:hypothetical protein